MPYYSWLNKPDILDQSGPGAERTIGDAVKVLGIGNSTFRKYLKVGLICKQRVGGKNKNAYYYYTNCIAVRGQLMHDLIQKADGPRPTNEELANMINPVCGHDDGLLLQMLKSKSIGETIDDLRTALGI